jgi:tetratricopeptide (TPR) repeat protein
MSPEATVRNGEQALKDATKACELTNYESVEAIKCLAAAHAEVGDFDEAIRWQRKAVELNKDEGEKEELAEALRLFEQKKPLRLE